MLSKSAFLAFCLLVASFVGYAQKGKLNYIDENGLEQGYWKVRFPDENGHNTIVYEGLYFNGKQVGVWKRWNNFGLIYSKEIYPDTLGEQFDVINYYRDDKVKSQGHMIFKSVHDSVQVYDHVKDSLKWIPVKHVYVKSGLWKSFWDNGILKETGAYYNDERKGTWFFYNESGALLKKEEY